MAFEPSADCRLKPLALEDLDRLFLRVEPLQQVLDRRLLPLRHRERGDHGGGQKARPEFANTHLLFTPSADSAARAARRRGFAPWTEC